MLAQLKICGFDYRLKMARNNYSVFVRCGVGERMTSCVFPPVKHGGGGVMVWGCLLVTLPVIYFKFKAQLTSMATTAFCSDTPSYLVWA